MDVVIFTAFPRLAPWATLCRRYAAKTVPPERNWGIVITMDRSPRHDFDRNENRDRIRQVIAIGIEQLDNGEGLDGDKVFEELLGELAQEEGSLDHEPPSLP
jgi:hypothetical protein